MAYPPCKAGSHRLAMPPSCKGARCQSVMRYMTMQSLVLQVFIGCWNPCPCRWG